MISNMISPMKKAKIHDIWDDFMKNYEFTMNLGVPRSVHT